MKVTIEQVRPDSPEAAELIAELDAYLTALYPASARWGLSVAQLISEDVAFFVIRADDRPAGCGGVKLEGDGYAELKRMYIRPDYRRNGLAIALLAHIEQYASSHGARALHLETGKHQTEAIEMYRRAGYRSVPLFGRYIEDGFSLFFEKRFD